MRADWDELFSSSVSATIEPVQAGAVACEWVRPPAARRDAAIVYLHGGGFRVGSPTSHREIIARLALEAGIQALAVDYRLVPEHLLPAALDDAMAVLEWLEKSGLPADRIALAGDSAGAALALGVMVARLQQGKRSPAAAYLMSAWTDLTASGESYQSHAALDPIHQRPMILAMARSALGAGASAEDPRLSPLLASAEIMRALPPILMQVGERETLLSDTEEFAARASAAGASVRSEIWPGMIHVFQQFPDELPEAREAVAAGGKFIAAHLVSVQAGSDFT
ncbi:alpha/beta hydrolase [Bradyrhizobium sp. 1]|uniref:alpha/beta hydrolase n=1 Tax=Bradyrhizobium sp. 1 TaxID=241591 RepID=UPI001FFC0EDA|nr:alpha/beta hydrolase [Bradyrhizobium sp. 1]MCK1394408.1 alpha/beta hydrolase [Bradyrhizobium sp. 1]